MESDILRDWLPCIHINLAYFSALFGNYAGSLKEIVADVVMEIVGQVRW